MAWIQSVATYLQSQNLGTQGTNLFIGVMPDTTTLTTLLTEYQGDVIETQGIALALQQPMLQVRVRGAKEDYVTPQTRILAIQTALANLPDQTLSGVRILTIRPAGTILSLGQDNNLRFEFSTNFEVTYE
jgi:hypothetical protein